MTLVTGLRKSDKSGAVLPDGTGARVRIEFYDNRISRRADLTDQEVEKLLGFAPEIDPRPKRARVRKKL